MNNAQKILKLCFSRLGIYFSKQPAKYDLLIEEIRRNLLSRYRYILHIGAHYGQERKLYSDLNLNVIWIEGANEPFKVLSRNIEKYKNQKAFQILLGDKNRNKVEFNRATNDASSSIYDFGKEMKIKNLYMESVDYYEMKRLDNVFSPKQMKNYKYWNIDVQGAELLVLKGAGRLLKIPEIIDIEVSTREEYKNAPNFNDIRIFLSQFGFKELWAPKEKSHVNVIFVKLK